MQKKMLAVAVASALGAPAIAMAQTSTVQIYGTLYLVHSLAHQGRGGAAAAGVIADRQNVDFFQSPGSNLGFKGEEKLGGGLSAWFQCESSMNYTNGTTGAGGELCSRNSALGLKGGFGNVFFGRWDQPFKRAAGPSSLGGNETGIFGTSFLRTGGSTSTLDASSRATFLRRQGNSINYDSPNFGGFTVMAGFSTDNGVTGASTTFPPAAAATGAAGTGATTGVTSSKPRVLSLGATYSSGPLFIGGGYERHNEFSAVGGELDDYGWIIGATYQWGPVRFGGQYTRQKFETQGPTALVGGGSTSATFPAWHLGVDWNISGPHGLRAAFTRANDAKGNATNTIAAGAASTNTLIGGTYRPFPCVQTAAGGVNLRCDNTGADLWQIRYVYTFSKRTEFNLGYVHLKNDGNASYALGGLVAPQIGEKQHAFAFNLRHTF